MSALSRFFTRNWLLKLLSLALAVVIYWAVHRG